MVLFFVFLAASVYRGTPLVSYEIFVDVAVGVLLLAVSARVRRGRLARHPHPRSEPTGVGVAATR